ncbi:MAG: DNA recombination protein RmuC, partial [Melioribacteraceae bacterium]|nr:DNA recombination protein RmuC [Melioribacteraceae bacterium]
MTELTILNLVLIVSVIIVLILILRKLYSQKPDEAEAAISKSIDEKFLQLENRIKDEFTRNREEYARQSKSHREEISGSIKLFGDQLFNRMSDISKMQKSQLDIFANQLTKLTESNEQKFEKLQEKVSTHLKEIQENNSKKLDQMRATVDEKLHATLEKRLGESFKLVSERLESVHKGLGDMQDLARGVGDLKNVLSNVKTRGTWGEVQLENLIQQILTPDQYSKNVATKKGSAARVEFAIKLPGRNEAKDDVTWIPVDAKFPLEDYQRLLESIDKSDTAAIESTSKDIERRIKEEAKNISSKYLDPPNTTDFAIMFLPIEGLYAEVLRRPGLFDNIQREFK